MKKKERRQQQLPIGDGLTEVRGRRSSALTRSKWGEGTYLGRKEWAQKDPRGKKTEEEKRQSLLKYGSVTPGDGCRRMEPGNFRLETWKIKRGLPERGGKRN